MTNSDFQPANVLLFDPEPALRHSTRSALLNIGFGDVVAVAEIDHFLEKAAVGDYDLILAETLSPSGDMLEIIRSVRQNIVGTNPFVNIILSMWNSAPEVVNKVINSGADDVISRPMSRTQILDRVFRLVQARKPFVVTTDYIGPDRHHNTRNFPARSAMIVPNSLRAKVENKPEFAATAETIKRAMTAVHERKISIYTEQLLRLSSAVLVLSGEYNELDDRKVAMISLRDINKRLMLQVKNTDLAHIVSFCEGLDKLIETIDKTRGSLKGQDRELLVQIPLAIHKACTEVQNSAALAFDIRDVAGKFRDNTSAKRPQLSSSV
ncbi:response regulator [Sneathiella sp.]|uniref:response regulator n=1 Tax=Sneathiella sp. TaxID=1964365 RepID=UPI003568449B